MKEEKSAILPKVDQNTFNDIKNTIFDQRDLAETQKEEIIDDSPISWNPSCIFFYIIYNYLANNNQEILKKKYGY